MFKSIYDWQLSEQSSESETITALAEKTQLPLLSTKVLYNKGFQTEEQITDFLSPGSLLHDPFLMHDMQKAVDRIQSAIMAHTPILIYGDYDADGMTSTTLLYETLETLGANVHYYVPNRFKDGYGPNLAVYQYFINQGIQLIVTVDNGIAGFEAIEYAKEQQVDVIVTDHHEIGKQLPDAYAIVHPRHPEGHYPFGDLAGVGVALKLAHALLGELPTDYLDITAIGTIADLVELTDENRTIVQLGMKQLKQTDRLGLQMFLEKEKVTSPAIDEETIGFLIAPRLNALGRMADPTPGVQLLTSFDPEEIESLLEQVEETNNLRKHTVDQITQNLETQMELLETLPPIIIQKGDDWHQGVLGIVASRLVEKYHRPTILLSQDEKGEVLKGSARSIPGIDIYRLLSQVKDQMITFGGHEMAAGMSVSKEAYTAWKDQLESEMSAFETEINRKPELTIDTIIKSDEVTFPNILALNQLRPFGTGFSKPYFLLRAIKPQTIQAIGKDKNTLKIAIETGSGDTLSAIGFKKGAWVEQLDVSIPLDMVVTLSINYWNGMDTPQLLIQDIKQEGNSLFDLRKVTSRQKIFAIEEAIYLSESKKFQATYQKEIPPTSRWLTIEEWQKTAKEQTAYSQLVIFDCIQNYQDIPKLSQASKIQNIYLFAYQRQSLYMVGLPTRQELGKAYHYFKTHPTIPLRNNEQKLAHFLGISLPRFHIIVEIFMETGILMPESDHVMFNTLNQSFDFKQTKTYQKYQTQIEAERFLVYNDSRTIKDHFFQEEQE